jgi:hypothetical protein
MKMAIHLPCMGSKMSTCRGLLMKSEEMPLGRPRYRWEENTKKVLFTEMV